MIVDCCIFLNELKLLEARLNYLDSVVDMFVVVESNYTFNGNKKPYHIQNNLLKFNKFKNKLIYVQHDAAELAHSLDFSHKESISSPWIMEAAQRDALLVGLEDLDSNTTILLGDVDEIPNREYISQTEHECTFDQQFFYYNFGCVNRNLWVGTVISPLEIVRQRSPEGSRKHRFFNKRIAPGGWHLSYWGSPQQIQYKISNFSHQEVNLPHLNNIKNIEGSIKNREDIFKRPEEMWLENNPDTIDADLKNYFSDTEYRK